MGKWGKYLKHYNPQWEKEDTFKHKLIYSSDIYLCRCFSFLIEKDNIENNDWSESFMQFYIFFNVIR